MAQAPPQQIPEHLQQATAAVADLHLSQRGFLFVCHLIANGNHKRRAALAAGYSPKSASVMASRLLNDDNIQRALHALRSDVRASVEALISCVADVAFDSDMADFQPFLSGEVDLATLRDKFGVDTRLVKKVRCRRRVTPGEKGPEIVEEIREIELYDRLAALRELLRQRTRGQDDEAEEAPVDVVFLGELHLKMAQAGGRPWVPGLPDRKPPQAERKPPDAP